jgi:hypothetical protein
LREIQLFYIEESIIREHVQQQPGPCDNEKHQLVLNKLEENSCIQIYTQLKEIVTNATSPNLDPQTITECVEEAEAFFANPAPIIHTHLEKVTEETSEEVELIDESPVEEALASTDVVEEKPVAVTASASVQSLKLPPLGSPSASSLDIKNKLSPVDDELNKSITDLSSEIASHDMDMQSSTSMASEPVEFTKCIEKLVASTQTVDKHLDNIQKPCKEFYEFEKQDLKLNAIKQTLESLALALKTCLLHKRSIVSKAGADGKSVAKQVDSLVRLHQSVVGKYKEKDAVYMKNRDKWAEFGKDVQSLSEWIDSTLSKLAELTASDLENNKLREVIKVRISSFKFFTLINEFHIHLRGKRKIGFTGFLFEFPRFCLNFV